MPRNARTSRTVRGVGFDMDGTLPDPAEVKKRLQLIDYRDVVLDKTKRSVFLRRKGTMSTLTEQGRRLYERGLELLEQAQSLSRELALVSERVNTQPLVISCQRGVSGWLCGPFAEFAATNRNIEPSINVGRYEMVIEDLIEGRADIGILLAYGPVIDLSCQPIGRERFSFFAAPSHPLAARSSISPAELKEHPFITTRRGGRFGQMVHNMLAGAAIRNYAVACQVQEGSVIRDLAILGFGIFCGPDREAQPALDAETLVRLPVEATEMFMDVYCALSPKRKPSRPTLGLLGLLKEHHAGTAGRCGNAGAMMAQA